MPSRLGSVIASLLLLGAGAGTLCSCGEAGNESTSAARHVGTATGTSTAATVARGTDTVGASTATTPGSAARPGVGGVPVPHPKGDRSRAHLIMPPPGSHPEPSPAVGRTAGLTVSDIDLSSAALKPKVASSGYAIEREYTCRGADRSPPVHWSSVPRGTAELVLFVLSGEPVGGHFYFDWAVAGLSPRLTGLPAGRLPAGAVVGRNGAGQERYTICPPAGKSESYLFVLYALPRRLSPAAGFEPAALRLQAKHIARHSGLLAGSYG